MSSTVTQPFVTCIEQTESGDFTNATYQLPNNNVNGIGVIVAFLLPAYVSWLVLILLYTSGLIPADLLNQFDTRFLRVSPKTESDWIAKFRRASFLLSVQQIVTGIGILAAALGTMSSMLVADFHSVIYLGWMSSNGYLATLTLSRGYLQEHSALRSLNLATMAALFLMLCFAIFPTTNFAWADHILIQPACPNVSSCVAFTTYVPALWHEASNTNLGGKQGHLSPQGVISYIILITGYIWQATMLFKKAHSRIHQFIRTPLFWLERALYHAALRRVQEEGHNNKNDRLISQVRYRLLLGLYLFFLAFFDLFSSFSAFLSIVTVSFMWASWELLMPRFHVYPACVRRTLDTWDFGQILPVLLLFAPLYNVIEQCFREGNPLKGILTRSIKSPQDTVHPNPETEPESQCTLSALFIGLGPSSRSTETDDNALVALHRRIYSVTYFRVLLTLLCILAVGAIVGYFVETTVALTRPPQPLTWYTKDWHLLPDIVAGVAAFVALFLVSLLVPFLSRSLSA